MGWFSDLRKYGLTAAQRARSRAAERYAHALAAYEQELAALSAPDARMAAERVLDGPRFIRAIRWSAPPTLPAELAPGLHSVFSRVRRVEVPRGEQNADAAEIEPLDWAPGYLRLGTDSEHSHLAVRPGDESIYVLGD